ncbi:hypothetical protein DB30_01461 [Enhygromyxa salina]|uniref:Uncharacterized protein n=1 Tax=Enhygromyxa salina TaxID=215803 RepID=A0A0C1Z466_9BACT|nr:hypothetical protein DB30_01461 [Enhygromyxa salina]
MRVSAPAWLTHRGVGFVTKGTWRWCRPCRWASRSPRLRRRSRAVTQRGF